MTTEHPDFSTFAPHRYACLTTYRKSGEGVDTAVWFVVDSGKLFIYTSEMSGKVKRLRNNPTARLAPSDSRGRAVGKSVPVAATFITGSEAEPINQLLNQRYGWIRKAMRWLGRLSGSHPVVYIQFSPREDFTHPG